MSSCSPRFLPNVYYLGLKSGQALKSIIYSEPEIPSIAQSWDSIKSFPALYKEWWLNLVAKDPIHVIVETTLLLSIVGILFYRSSKDWRELEKEKLTPKEEAELVDEWKQTRAPLTPTTTTNEDDLNFHSNILVHTMKGKYMTIQRQNKPKPEQVINFATFDFLGMSAEEDTVKKAAQEALDRYGCGSCGPRGFYGTIDVHLDLEKQFADFLKTDGAILYSDGASMCSSTVAAFAKRGDLLVVDEGVYEPLLTGVSLSRAQVKYFKHNDMKDLRRVLKQVLEKDKKLGRKPNAQKRFIVVEGLYKNTGTIAPLDEIVKLKHEFHYRLILDESFSFGTLGPNGRGALEMHGKELMKDAEIVTVSIENSMGSIGGITVGSEEVVDHQRLSGSGYCFSASSPPFTASAAIASLEQLQRRPELLGKLRENLGYMHERMTTVCEKELNDLFLIMSDNQSPILFLQVADLPETRDLDELAFLKEVADACLDHGVAVATTGLNVVTGPSPATPPPGVRITVSALHTKEDIEKMATTFKTVVSALAKRFSLRS